MSEDAAERWFTYRELGAHLGCTPNAARMHATRRGWLRRPANRPGDPVHVLVPQDVLVQTNTPHASPRPNGAEQTHASSYVHGLVQAVEALREQLMVANRRIDEFAGERRQWAEERRALIAILTDQRRRPWWRRWFR
jgi:hypothetical protein